LRADFRKPKLSAKAGAPMKSRNFKAPSGATIKFTEIGFGTAPLGNLFKPLTNKEAEVALEAAWKAGIRYFDTAPLYGLGLSETRLNHFLYGRKRSDFVISTKVGRLMDVCPPAKRTGIGKFFQTPSRVERFDYSYDGIMRSLEFSLERLGLDQVEILLVHDIDIANHGTAKARDSHVRTLMKSGYKALTKLRNEKTVKAIGAGINEWQVAETLAKSGEFDLFLLAGRYTLLEQEALNSFMPLCQDKGIGLILGGTYNSGILATGAKPGAKYNYEPAPRHILDRVAKIEAICRAHKVQLPQAALRFPLSHPSVVSVIPGAISPKQVALNMKTMAAKIPKALWRDLKTASLLQQDAPIPQ
jgi:D-threo-aldose 1-dehydrogenase